MSRGSVRGEKRINIHLVKAAWDRNSKGERKRVLHMKYLNIYIHLCVYKYEIKMRTRTRTS